MLDAHSDPKTLLALRKRVSKEWKNLEPDLLMRLVCDMPKRIQLSVLSDLVH